MNFKMLKKQYLASFRSKNEFYELIFFLKGWTRTDCMLRDTEEWSVDDITRFINAMHKLETKPLSYVTNVAHFYVLQFYVDERVIIPRPETELIVDTVIKSKGEYPIYADVCAGSGCIGLSVAKFKSFKTVYLSDISLEAIEVININQKKLGIEATILQGDFLEPLLTSEIKLNLLTINPPYITKGDSHLEKMVSENEPPIALYADDDGLCFYRRLFADFAKIMDTTQPFLVVCEFGFAQKNQIFDLYIESGLKYKIEFKKDYASHWRYFIIRN